MCNTEVCLRGSSRVSDCVCVFVCVRAPIMRHRKKNGVRLIGSVTSVYDSWVYHSNKNFKQKKKLLRSLCEEMFELLLASSFVSFSSRSLTKILV